MAIQSKVGHLQLVSGSGANIVVTGVGFQPQLVLFWMTGENSAGADLTSKISKVGCFGFSDSVGGSHGYCPDSEQDSIAVANPSASGGNGQTGFAVHLQDGVHGSSDWNVSAFGADGFTLHKSVGSSAPWANFTVHWLCLAGLTNHKTGQFTATSNVSGNQSITGFGFKPDFVLCFTSRTSFGMADGTGNQVSVASYSQDDNAAASGIVSAKSYGRSGEFLDTFVDSGVEPNPIDAIAKFVSMDSGGFTINWTQASLTGATPTVDYIAFGGSNASVGTFNTRTDTNPISVPTPNCTALVALFLSTCNPASALDAPDPDATISIGAYDGTNQGAQACRNQQGVATTNVVDSLAIDTCYANPKSNATLQGSFVATGLSSIAGHMGTADPQANMIAFAAFGNSPPPPANVSHSGDIDVLASQDHSHSGDLYVAGIGQESHKGDLYVNNLASKSHGGDIYIFGIPQTSHSGDLLVSAFVLSYVKLAGTVIFPINPANGYVRLNATTAQPQLSYVQLLATIKAVGEFPPVNLAGTIKTFARSYARLAGTILRPGPSHSGDLVVATPALSYVNLAATIETTIQLGFCGKFPDASFVKLAGWIVQAGDSIQMPNSGFQRADDFLSSQTALQAYKPMSIISLAGFNLIATALTLGVVSWQTRTRSWLTRQDEAPGGILLTTTTNTHTLPNGAVITTVTQQFLIQDTTKTVVTVTNSGTPNRTSVIITEKTRGGQITTRELDTININGIINSTEKKTVFTEPPTKDNVQPITVRTLDGITHYQFFGEVNNEWAGGEQEGITSTANQEQIIPGILNGQTQDQYGNPILTKITASTVTDPSGKVTMTRTEQTGARRDVGTTTTDTTEQFVGIQTKTHKVVTYPDGSQEVTDTTTNDTTGDSTETSVETVTDEYGQVTITTTNTETKTFTDPVTGLLRQTITKTVTVNKSGVVTKDTTTVVSDNFDDSIVNDKIKVLYIQEVTITCVIDEFTMYALLELNISHQKQFALVELFTQMLGNANLSFALRNSLIQQYNAANCIPSVPLQANGRIFQVIFAPSASAFRAKYIVGTEPHVYELQLILQERSDLINGTRGFL
jgi:hypothetical protein